MSSPEIFNSQNILGYSKLHADLKLDIYYQEEFLNADAFLQNCSYEIFVLRKESDLFIYPYLKKDVGHNCYDITSPYGYCGPYSTSENFFIQGEQAFLDYVQSEKKIVSEFIRYHPLYNAGGLMFKQQITNIRNRTLVMLDCKNNWRNIWEQQFSGTNRNLIRKLKNEKFVFEILDYERFRDEFIKLYFLTMQNVEAKDFYFFRESYFELLKSGLKEKLMLTRVSLDDETYAMALFFISGDIVTYFLSARNIAHAKVPATNYLLSSMVEWAVNNGFSYLNLGGGITDGDNDSLFKFKSNFSRKHLDFFIGKRIHRPDIYVKLAEEWIDKNGHEKYDCVKQMLQFYHD
ncbi:GNAT family N-acetyltransferase [Chitinophaga polysaccharea]|uniref:GNAT family N-acetyltransferase n=1 Tax=Chitinophaga polysaccharea TaxID=1293035 RepID=UPI001454E9A0|nr:GNAT family N-acetyltransferase [Chitinophaga polysaccharea]NLR61849.1 GNAT family N-acetyltransferase [Chitinophaga polysaccharea]